MDTRKWFILILVLTIACGFLLAPIGKKPEFLKEIKITPGIDIAGGADLTYRILYSSDAEKREERKRPQAVIDTLRKRINQRGLKEPRLTTLDDDKVVIQIAVQKQDELEDYKALLKRVGKLELRSVASPQVHETWKRNPDWKTNPRGTSPAGWAAFKMKDSEEWLLCSDQPVITGADVTNASHQVVHSIDKVQWKVDFQLTGEGGKKFDAAAAKLYNPEESLRGKIAIIMDEEILSAPVVNSEAFHGSGEISGNFDQKGAENLAITLRSGQLPVAIGMKDETGRAIPGEPESQNFIGPTLAQDSLRRGVMAAAIAALVVALFMIVYYRAGGLIAVFSLICNVVYLLTIMAIFKATMTLPGLAALALSVGMAVDNNILILERIREEMARGKTVTQAAEAGHSRALSAIMDGNITTLLAAGVLYYFGTDAVQGFATVLAIGLLTTLFSVLVVQKIMIKLLVQAGTIREFRMMKLWEKLNVNFVRMMPAFAFGALAIFLGSLAIFGTRVNQSLGMDFKGGTRLIFKLYEDRPIEHVRQMLDGIKGPDGRPLYSDVEVTAMGKEASSATKIQILTRTSSNAFQIRSSTQDLGTFQSRVQEAFREEMSHSPFDPIEIRDLPDERPFYVKDGERNRPYPPGGWFYLYLQEEGFDETAVRNKLVELARGIVSEDTEEPPAKVNLRVDRVHRTSDGRGQIAVPGAKKDETVTFETEAPPARLVKLRVLFAKPDLKVDQEGKPPEKYIRYLQMVKDKGELKLAESPFTSPGRIGPTAASDLRDSTIWAMTVACVLMIVYIAVRFPTWKFGLSAVIALAFDAAVPVGFVALCGWIVPKSWGLSFEMNVTTVAAILTVIGYAVNDTVVVFDRIRENLVLMKKETFAEIANVSVNQTMSRTVLTGVSVLTTCAILYVFTMTSAGGVAEFALPMFLGVVAGTFASIYIATPLLLWLSGGKKPVVAK